MAVEAGLPAAIEAVLGETGGSLPVRGADAEQLALLPEGRVTRDQVELLPRGRGRPRGSVNRRTAAWRDYLARRYTHPLETLAAIQSTPADVLAAQLGCKPVEALAIIKSAAAELAPYMEGKQPIAIDLNANINQLGMLVIEGVTHSREEIGEIIEGEFLRLGELDGDEEEMAENSHSSDGPAEPLE